MASIVQRGLFWEISRPERDFLRQKVAALSILCPISRPAGTHLPITNSTESTPPPVNQSKVGVPLTNQELGQAGQALFSPIFNQWESSSAPTLWGGQKLSNSCQLLALSFVIIMYILSPPRGRWGASAHWAADSKFWSFLATPPTSSGCCWQHFLAFFNLFIYSQCFLHLAYNHLIHLPYTFCQEHSINDGFSKPSTY